MTHPANIIIKETGPFYDQPYWVEDYYETVIKEAGATHTRIAYGPVTDRMRYLHKFPPDSAGVAVTFSNPYEPEKGQISGFIMGKEQYERFTTFIHNGYRLPDKNNFVLIDDIVATIVHNRIFDNSNRSLDEVYDIIRETVYKARPNSGPDDVWVDTLVDAMHDEGFANPERAPSELQAFLRNTFTQLVYGYHPKPEPCRAFTDALEAALTQQGYAQPTPGTPTIREIITETALKEPYTPWMQEPAPSPMRDSNKTIKAVKEMLHQQGYINNAGHLSLHLEKLLEETIYQTIG